MASSSYLLALDSIVYALAHHPELAEGEGRIALLHGQPHDGLSHLIPRLVCEQSYKPRAVSLEAGGYSWVEKIEGTFDLVLLLPERQKEQTYADLARCMELLNEGGTLLVSLHNDWGARRFQDRLEELAGVSVEVITKHHCRAFWVKKKSGKINKALLEEWRGIADLRRAIDDRFWSKPGLFAWNRVDIASALLASALPSGIHGYVADLGCGWGYLSCEVLEKCNRVLGLDAFDADRDAVEAARRNVGNILVPFRPKVFWQDVTQGVAERKYDYVVMNPPFHEGREPDPGIGMKFIVAAARAMKATGELWLVANRQLPYEELLTEAFDNIEQVVQKDGFKVIKASMPRHDLFFRRSKRDRRGR